MNVLFIGGDNWYPAIIGSKAVHPWTVNWIGQSCTSDTNIKSEKCIFY